MSKVMEELRRVIARMRQENVFGLIQPGFAYLQLKFYNALTGDAKPFPEGTPVKVFYVDATGKRTAHTEELQVRGKEGKLSFRVQQQTNLTFEIAFKERYYLDVTGDAPELITAKDLLKELKKDEFYCDVQKVFMLPKTISLKDCNWKTEVEFYDDAADKRYFADLAENELNEDGDYIEMVLWPEWQRISFRYTAADDDTDKPVPQYILLQGFNKAISTKRPVTRSSVWVDDAILIPWFEKDNLRANRDKEKIVFKFKAPGKFVDLGIDVVKEDPKKKIWEMDLVDRQTLFDLPDKFVSKNWRVLFDAKWADIKEVINEADACDRPGDAGVAKGKRIDFYLDSVVLSKKNSRRISWQAANRFTVFNSSLQIQQPDPDKTYLTKGTLPAKDNAHPYWKDGKLDDNFFVPAAIGLKPRVIGLNGDFYDITNRRTTKGDLIGARLALLDDSRVHHGDRVREPLVKGAGNFKLHLFTRCLDTTGAETNCLMIHWSTRYNLVNSPVGAPPCAPAHPNPLPTDFDKTGFKDAWDRWMLKGYLLKTKGPIPVGQSEVTVHPVFFFEPLATGTFRATMNLNQRIGGGPCGPVASRHQNTSARSSMGLDSCTFYTDDWQKAGAAHNEDGQAYQAFTMSHELGHACGLDDEYIESLSYDPNWNPVLPKFGQYYPGMPYSIDKHSMMLANQTPRLRHFWYLCRWLNRVKSCQKLLAKTELQVVKESGTARQYTLSDKWWNFYAPAYKSANFKNGTNRGRFDLYLYKLGDDETAALGPGGIDSILVVRPKIEFTFNNDGADTWDVDPASGFGANKLAYMRNFQTAVTTGPNGLNAANHNRFWLEATDAVGVAAGKAEEDFKKVYIYFVPHYEAKFAANGEHFVIEVEKNSGAHDDPSYYTHNLNRKTITVDEQQNRMTIMRYVLGLAPFTVAGAVKTDTTTVAAADLGFLAEWVRKQRTKKSNRLTYAVHE